jgi:MoaA/NifB/PqqE/SkfB family radical SAM enzyme
MKIRILPESNYRGIYVKGKTLRVPLDPSKPITALRHPEFYDVKITEKCNGECPYCYQDSMTCGEHFKDVPRKIMEFFGSMGQNERPFQVAIGGGEPTLHPEFGTICGTFKELGIDPNYTTNGTAVTDDILRITKDYVNGVAVSCHPHLDWRAGADRLIREGVYTNLHIIISDKESVDHMLEIYEEYAGGVKYYVLLPLIQQGRAEEEFKCWDYLAEQLEQVDRSEIAFGAMFYPYIKGVAKDWDISLYEPESMSRYLVMDDSMSLHPSSFAVGEG